MCDEIYKTYGFAASRTESWDTIALTKRNEAIRAGLKKYDADKPFGNTDVHTESLISWRLHLLHKFKKPKKPLTSSNAADAGQSQGISEKVVRAYDADDCRYKCKCTYRAGI